jgi:hypothetical protein
LCQCLVQMRFNGAAFRVLFSGGIVIPIYAAYPIGFQDLSRMLFKFSVIQLPMFLIYAGVSGALIAHSLGMDFPNNALLGLKAGLLIFAARFIITALAFSSGTNDSSKFRIRTIGLLFIFVACCGLFLGLGAAGFFVSNAALSWLLSFAAILDAYALFRIYGWFYNANRFDLMAFPRR